MQLLTDTDQAIGKTIKEIHYDFEVEAIVIFTDNSYMILGSISEYGDESSIYITDHLSPNDQVKMDALEKEINEQ